MASINPAFGPNTSAVSRTPNDVWNRIFELTYLTRAHHLDSLKYPPASIGYILSLVCKRLPLLWRTICIFPFEYRDAGPLSLLKYQNKRAGHLNNLDVYISTLSQHILSADAAFLAKRVDDFLDVVASPTGIARLHSLHVTTDEGIQMARILSCFRNGIFARLDAISLTMRRSSDVILPKDTLRGVHFANLRSVTLNAVILDGLCFRNNGPTALDIAIDAESARHSMRPLWTLADTAGASLLTTQFNVAFCDKMLLPGICEDRENLSVVHLSINAGCAKILLGSGSFQRVTSVSFADIPHLEEFMGVLHWGSTTDPSSKLRARDGRTLLPRLQSLHLDLCTSRRTFAESWRKLFRLTKHVMRFMLESSFPTARSRAPKSILLTMELVVGGVKMWPHLTRISIRDRPDVMLESCLSAVLDVFACEGWAITFDLGDRTREYMRTKSEKTNERLREITETFEQSG